MKIPLVRLKWSVAFALLWIAASAVASISRAETVMKLSLDASQTTNIDFNNGSFEMTEDGIEDTPGDRNASIDYVIPYSQTSSFGLPISVPSMTLTDISAAGSPANNGAFIMQAFNEGILEIYGAGNELLLQADLTKSGLQGALGGPSKQGLFLAFGEVTGGALKYRLIPDSLQLRMKFPAINGGFSVSGAPNSQLNNFNTWTGSVEIMATIIPEPSLLLPLGAFALGLLSARCRRR